MNLQQFAADNDSPTFAKIGIYGSAGTGKTRVAYEFASGLIKDKGLTKPVAFFDTEKGSDWILPMFRKDGIECFVKKSRSFKDLMKMVEIAEQEASVLIIDSISHVWRELTEAFLEQYNRERYERMARKNKEWADKNFQRINKLEFQHWNTIKPLWAKFTERYLNSNLHIIVNGRAGTMYEYQENEQGKKELIQSGTRMATEKELSYEPSLLIELVRKQINGQDRLFALIEKDRSDTINGREFELIKYPNIKPHIDFINIGGQAKVTNFNENGSATLFEGNTIEPSDDFAQEKKQREIFCEEIKGLLEMKIPGMSAEAKQRKNALIEQVFHTLSWTKVEGMNSEVLKAGLDELRTILASE
jgi:hypothetical protein